MVQFNPLVSIVIPNYNRAQLIPETLSSLVNQTYKNWEAIVVDDGSTDQSAKVIAEFAKYDKRIKLFDRCREPKGAPTCRNIGLNQSSGTYLIFLDSDDLLAPFCIEQRVSYFAKYNHFDFCVFPGLIFKWEIYDSNVLINGINDKDDLLRFLDQDTPWLIFNPIWKTSSLNKYGLTWDEAILSFQDYDFHLKALIKGMAYTKVDAKPDCFWRKHAGDNISNTNNSERRIESLQNVLINAYKALDKANLLKKEYQRSFASSYLDLVHRYISINSLKSAISIWNQAYELSLINKKIYIEGRGYIFLRSVPLLNNIKFYNKLIMKLYFNYWGKEFFLKNYGTFLRTQYKD